MSYWTASTHRTNLTRPESRPSSIWVPTGIAHAVEATEVNREPGGRTTLCSRPAVQGDLWAFEQMDFEGNGVRQSQIVTRCPECIGLLPPLGGSLPDCSTGETSVEPDRQQDR